MVDETTGQLSIDVTRASAVAPEFYDVTCSNCASDSSSRYLVYSGVGVRLTVYRTSDLNPNGWFKSYFEGASGNLYLLCQLIEN